MKRRGFTLIELVVVLTIMVVLLGLVIVRVGGWSSRQSLAASARTLGNTIRTFREKAQLEERVYIMVLDPENGAYTVTTEAEEGYFGQADVEEVRKARLEPGQTFAKIEVGSVERRQPLTFYFTPKGVVPETRVTIGNAHDEEVVLTIGALLNEVEYAETR